jgi:hypothetical protein
MYIVHLPFFTTEAQRWRRDHGEKEGEKEGEDRR